MTEILILGGHGKVGLLAEPMLVEAGNSVEAVVRNPDHVADVEATGARAVVADLEMMGQEEINKLVGGHDVVVWTAGAGGGDVARTKAVDEEAALRVLSAVEKAGARFIMVSYFGASLDHGVPPEDPFFAYAEAKAHADDAIRRSEASWVILAPSSLTLDDESGVEIQADAAREVPRASVARMIAEVVARPGLSGVTVSFNEGPTAPGEALDAI